MKGKAGQVSAVVWCLSARGTAGGQHQQGGTPPSVPVDAGRTPWAPHTAPPQAAAPHGTAVTDTGLGNAPWLQAGARGLLNSNGVSTDYGYVTHYLGQKNYLTFSSLKSSK